MLFKILLQSRSQPQKNITVRKKVTCWGSLSARLPLLTFNRFGSAHCLEKEYWTACGIAFNQGDIFMSL